MRTVAIAGVGLIGGSFGLALRKAGYTGTILGVSSQRSIDEATRLGAIDRGVTLQQAAAEADLLFLSQPIGGIITAIRELGPLARKEMLITDAGSTKREIEEAAAGYLVNGTFLGGHPMAGKESRGVSAADPDLFRGRPWILTTELNHPVAHLFRHWIARLGARELFIDAVTHDRLVAWGSHLPQLASTALASMLAEQAPEAANVAGPGLTDMTRLAMSSYDLWRDILATNRSRVNEALSAYIAKLQELKNDLETDFTRGAEFARGLRDRQ